MATIWKHVLQPLPVQEVEVPKGAKFLEAREQDNKMCVWYLCDPSVGTERRRLYVVGTGRTVPHDGEYVGTTILDNGSSVLHIFVRRDGTS